MLRRRIYCCFLAVRNSFSFTGLHPIQLKKNKNKKKGVTVPPSDLVHPSEQRLAELSLPLEAEKSAGRLSQGPFSATLRFRKAAARFQLYN